MTIRIIPTERSGTWAPEAVARRVSTILATPILPRHADGSILAGTDYIWRVMEDDTDRWQLDGANNWRFHVDRNAEGRVVAHVVSHRDFTLDRGGALPAEAIRAIFRWLGFDIEITG